MTYKSGAASARLTKAQMTMKKLLTGISPDWWFTVFVHAAVAALLYFLYYWSAAD